MLTLHQFLKTKFHRIIFKMSYWSHRDYGILLSLIKIEAKRLTQKANRWANLSSKSKHFIYISKNPGYILISVKKIKILFYFC